MDKLIIFVDELNKYAPSGNSRTSSLKDTLVDISARGRHLSLTLFGAQQFRSKVDDEVIGNAATSLYGRIGDEELTNASYRSFSGTTREELLQLEKGRLLLRHAHYAVPVFGRFPRPPVLMGKQGTDIFGQQKQDPASSVLAVMRNLTPKPPAIAAIRTEIEGVPRSRSTRPSTPCRLPIAPATAPQTRTRTSAGTSNVPRGQAQAAATPPRYSPAWIGCGTSEASWWQRSDVFYCPRIRSRHRSRVVSSRYSALLPDSVSVSIRAFRI